MNYQAIFKEDMVNGDGLRVVLWVSGCEHHCLNCHNPETWAKESGKPYTKEVEKELMGYLDNDFIDGLTLSGGDPLAPYNREAVTKLCKKIRNKYNMYKETPTRQRKTIWVYTGYKYEEVKDLEIMKYINVLVDGEFVQSKYDRDLLYKGSSNQRVIDVQKTRKHDSIILKYE